MANDHAERGIRNHAERGLNPAELDDKISMTNNTISQKSNIKSQI